MCGIIPIFINSGIGGFLKIGAADIFEDYRITGGAKIPSSFNTEYIVSFENLKRRLDEEWLFHRMSMDYLEGNSLAKHHTNEIRYNIKWPLTNVMGFRTSLIARHDRAVYAATDLINLEKSNLYKYWGGFKAEFIFDNTISKGLNLYYGTRYKIFAEHFIELDATEKNMTVIGLDFRNYKKIHKSFIWANRIAASSSFGKERLIYYMGGVDTWLFPKFNSTIPIDYNQNYIYQTLATNMRGFKQNIRNGNSFFVINSELRFPAIKYFSNRPLKSDFFENFQIIGFGDLGTAWTGSNPYSKENSLFKQVIYQNPLTITLENIREPIVGGYGFGLRSRVLGYFVRVDWAWGVEDGIVQPRIFYLSFSLDF